MERYLMIMKKDVVKATTFDRVESTFKYHIKEEFIGRKQIGAITSEDIQRLLNEKCKAGLSASSIKKIYNLLKEFYRYANSTKIIGYNPMELVQMPKSANIKYKKKDMEILTVEEVKRVIKVAEQVDAKGQPVYRYGEAIILLLATGLRSGELRALNVRDIDIKKRSLIVNNNASYAKDRENGGIRHDIGTLKTQNAHREVPLNDRAILSIQRLMNTTCNQETGYLVCTSTGKIVNHSNLQRCYDAILTAAGIEHKGLHSTRHTFATIVLKNVGDERCIKEISQLLGHSKVSTTYEFYIKPSDNQKRELVTGLDDVFQ
jgi:integrase